MRLYIKHRLEDKEDLSRISRKAFQINQRIVDVSHTNITAADHFARKSAEYLALSTVAVRSRDDSILAATEAVKEEAKRIERAQYKTNCSTRIVAKTSKKIQQIATASMKKKSNV